MTQRKLDLAPLSALTCFSANVHHLSPFPKVTSPPSKPSSEAAFSPKPSLLPSAGSNLSPFHGLLPTLLLWPLKPSTSPYSYSLRSELCEDKVAGRELLHKQTASGFWL